MTIAKAAVFLFLVFTLWCSTQGARVASGPGLKCKTVEKSVGEFYETVRESCVSLHKRKRTSDVRTPTWAKGQSNASISFIGQMPKSAGPTCTPITHICFPGVSDPNDGYIYYATIGGQYVYYSAHSYGAVLFCEVESTAVKKNCQGSTCSVTSGIIEGTAFTLSRADVCKGMEVASAKFVSPGFVRGCSAVVTPAVNAVAPSKKQHCATQTVCRGSFPAMFPGYYSYKCQFFGVETSVGIMCYYDDTITHVVSCLQNVVRKAACSLAWRFVKVTYMDDKVGNVGLQVTYCSN